MVNDRPNITLVRLVLKYPDWFYPQDWYYGEEFANTPLALGEYRIPDSTSVHVPSAVAISWWLLSWKNQSEYEWWANHYVWTSDVDDEGNKVYVGGWSLGRRKGFQIHRHLANPVVSAIPINYSWSKL